MESTLPRSRSFRLVDWLVDYRVSVSFVLFTLVIIENVANSRQPLAPSNLRDPWAVAGLTLLALGLGMRSWAAGVLRKGQALATTGPYQICRHPLYLGSCLMMAGFCALLNDPIYLIALVGPVTYIYWLTIEREERRLAERHGDAWTRFAANSSRLIPFRWPRKLYVAWSLAQWLKNREYKAVLATAIALAALQIWSRQ
jgi:protein-S-isoprenylcysteine O-methyltransferase Ste14